MTSNSLPHNAPPAPSGSAPSVPSSAATPRPATRRVVDDATRMLHWLMALSFTGAYITADGERWRLVHVTLGYTLAGLLVARQQHQRSADHRQSGLDGDQETASVEGVGEHAGRDGEQEDR